MSDNSPATPRPPAVLTAALLLALVELGAMIALVVGMVIEVVGGAARGGGTTIALAAVFLVITALLALAVRALHRGQRWGRAPILTWQLLLLAVGVSQAATLEWWVAALLVVLPVLIGVGLLLPPSVDWTVPASPARR